VIFAQNVRRIRAERRLSQEALAGLAELHRTYIGSIERAERNVSVDNMERIARALGVPLRVLVEEPER
jgi:transcriptional regulator with XRE-family HTH domain